jgi:SecD/SecF fusion protein
MQNKKIISTFAILLTLSCAYQLSFSWFAYRFEQKAEVFAQQKQDSIAQATPNLRQEELNTAKKYWKDYFLKQNAATEIYPVTGATYQECKLREINLGLDLQGGMSVTLEVSIPDLILQLSENSQDSRFKTAFELAETRTKTGNTDFITAFAQTWQETSAGASLIDIFHNYNQKDKFQAGISDAEVIAIIRQEAINALDGTEKIIRTRIDQFGVSQPLIQKQFSAGRIQIELPGVKDKERVRKILQSTANLEFYESLDAKDVLNSIAELDKALSVQWYPNYRDSVDRAASAPKQKAKKSDIALDSLNIEQDLASADELETMEKEDPFSGVDKGKYAPIFSKFLPSQGGPILGIAKVADTAQLNSLFQHSTAKNFLPKNVSLIWDGKGVIDINGFPTGEIQLYAIQREKNQALIDGKTILDAYASLDPMTGKPTVNMVMDNNGRRIWKEVTTKKLGKFIAITLDNKVLSAPVVSSVIPDGRSVINGSFSYDEAKDLSSILKAGALPVPAKISAENFVGPSLGAENINASMISFAVAIALILLYMIAYYGKAGIATNVALLLNLFLLLGVLVSLGATLNLPSIAGLILTIGMAVDANVLIFERIREELAKGKALAESIADGYKNALWSILDANITTTLTGVVLLLFGMGPIKGFAVTLLIGIGTSLATGIFVSRFIFDSWLDRKKEISFATPLTKGLFKNINFDFVGKRKIFYALSLGLIVLGAVSLFTRGLDYGVDFAGGRKFKVKFEQGINENALREALAKTFTDERGLPMTPEVKQVEDNKHAFITTKYLINQSTASTDSLVEAKLMEGLSQVVGKNMAQVESVFLVDAAVSNEMKTSAWFAVIGALLVIFLYIAIRFRKWQFGFGALAALSHDVLLVLAVFSVAQGWLPFSLEIDQNLIAALLTVVGYSINDTVVVYDRLREYQITNSNSAENFNQALNSTLSRTINTSLTTLLVLMVILFFGGESIKGFVFAMTVGVIVGTYSSVFIASPLVWDALHRNKK